LISTIHGDTAFHAISMAKEN